MLRDIEQDFSLKPARPAEIHDLPVADEDSHSKGLIRLFRFGKGCTQGNAKTHTLCEKVPQILYALGLYSVTG